MNKKDRYKNLKMKCQIEIHQICDNRKIVIIKESDTIFVQLVATSIQLQSIIMLNAL